MPLIPIVKPDLGFGSRYENQTLSTLAEGESSDPHDFTLQAEVAQIDFNRPNFATHLS